MNKCGPNNYQQGIHKQDLEYEKLAKMHSQLYMWLHCFQNYKKVKANCNSKLDISEKHVRLHV